ncbi:unnamed protein product, partial [Prorocentrum cordatum]
QAQGCRRVRPQLSWASMDRVPRPPGTCRVEHRDFRIVIMEAPVESNSAQYVTELKSQGVTDVVRTCEPTYSPERFESEGIRVHEMTFPDGAAPPEETIQRWTDLLRRRYRSKDPADSGVVAVHCLAGLGRAPVLAAVALIEMTRMDYMDAVEKIREVRRGAINVKQVAFLKDSFRIQACHLVAALLHRDVDHSNSCLVARWRTLRSHVAQLLRRAEHLSCISALSPDLRRCDLSPIRCTWPCSHPCPGTFSLADLLLLGPPLTLSSLLHAGLGCLGLLT